MQNSLTLTISKYWDVFGHLPRPLSLNSSIAPTGGQCPQVKSNPHLLTRVLTFQAIGTASFEENTDPCCPSLVCYLISRQYSAENHSFSTNFGVNEK